MPHFTTPDTGIYCISAEAAAFAIAAPEGRLTSARIERRKDRCSANKDALW